MMLEGNAAPSDASANPEVADSDLTLLQAIEAGEIDLPELLPWSQWMSWRRGPGRRPAGRRPISGEESLLWRRTMLALYGDVWQDTLRGRVATPVPTEQVEGGSNNS